MSPITCLMEMANQLPDHGASSVADESIAPGLRATIVGSIGNVVLMIFKLWAGFASRSQALIADGIHSFSDLFSDFVVYLGLKWGRKGADENHPYGHARIETISGLIVGLLLILIGAGIAYNAISAIRHHEIARPGVFAIVAAAISIVLKEGLYWYTVIIGRKLRSMALVANAWHHRSDALSSVVVLIGVGATYINPDWYPADSYAALVVTFFVVRVGLRLVRPAFWELSDAAPDRVVLDQLSTAAAKVLGVRQVHDLKARYSGPQIFVELDIVVDPKITVEQGHAIAREVRQHLLHHFTDVTRVIVHVDPERK
ncbi:MAG: cation diffusion facilitator family transporter [Candidatus Zixiibacteriota bacterium]